MKRNRQIVRKFLSSALLFTAFTLGLETALFAQNRRSLPEHLSQTTETQTPSAWSRGNATEIEPSANTVIPPIESFDNLAAEANVWVWDSWPLRDRDGSLAQINGYYVLFSLVAPRALAPIQRHDEARIAYWYSRNGRDWEFAGAAFPPETGLGSRQWSGSAIYDDGELYLFYTATGRQGNPEITMEQRLALTKATVLTSDRGVEFVDWSPHQIILESEGVYYQNQAQSNFDNSSGEGGNDIIYAFRDPWFFEDPVDGNSYILFAANTPGIAGNKTCSDRSIGDAAFANVNVPRAAVEFNGSVGLAIAPDPDNLFVWERLPMIFHAECVNQQLEVPRFLFKDGKYYLFFATHKFAFAPGLEQFGLDALYGFVADSLRGDYRPLNGNGVVLSNPPTNPLQTFAWIVMPNQLVLNYINYRNVGDVPLDRIGDKSPEFQRSHFGGMLAPTIQIEVSGDRTRIVEVLEQGVIVAPD